MEALGALPVQQALGRKALALAVDVGVDVAQETPPPRDPVLGHVRRQYPPMSGRRDVEELALTAARPRDRKLKVERT